MLLPQSDAFKTLHARLHSVPTMALLKLEGGLGPSQDLGLPSQTSIPPGKHGRASRQQSRISESASKDAARSQLVDFEQLLEKFKDRQVRFWLELSVSASCMTLHNPCTAQYNIAIHHALSVSCLQRLICFFGVRCT